MGIVDCFTTKLIENDPNAKLEKERYELNRCERIVRKSYFALSSAPASILPLPFAPNDVK
jgi:hypothetical protein